MFHILKKKPFLKDLLPNNHLDFHSHLLPGLDDGAKTIADSLLLAKGMQEMGITKIITSPHVLGGVWENTSSGIGEKLCEVQHSFEQAGLAVEISAAAEYMLDGPFWEALQKEPLRTLRDKYVLVEMSYINPPIQLFEILFDLQVAGYKPVLAHPERYMFYHADFSHYEKLRHAGCLFQVNLLSTIGYYGGAVTQAAIKLLEKGWIDLAGSDMHHRQHLAGFSQRVLLKDTKALEAALDANQMFR